MPDFLFLDRSRRRFAVKRLLIACAFSAAALPVHAETTVSEPWVRATVPQQKATGAFMQLKSDADARLVSVSSPAAGVVEVHEMAVVDNLMTMRRLAGLELPAGRAVELKPGGYHIMLIGLKRQVKEGEQVPLTLVIERRDGQRETVEVSAPVRPLNAAGAEAPAKHGQGH
jgi:copper(I)-binding protein